MREVGAPSPCSAMTSVAAARMAVADLLDQLGVDRLLYLTDFELQFVLVRFRALLDRFADGEAAFPSVLVLRPLGLLLLLLDFVGDRDDFHLAGVLADQVQLVHHRIEAVIVRPQRLQDLPYDGIGLVVVQGFMRFDTSRDHHRQDHITALLARCVAHDTTD
jgi:hypothetical protein